VNLISYSGLCQWLSQTPWSIYLREAPYPYPVLIIVHVLTITVFGGMVVLCNLRVLGWALPSVPALQLITQFRPWKWLAFALLLISGLLLALSDPIEYADNPMFWLSNALLVAVGVNAWLFRHAAYRELSVGSAATPRARWWARSSLVLWITLVFVGRAIAFF
jgi:hypothetical protein